MVQQVEETVRAREGPAILLVFVPRSLCSSYKLSSSLDGSLEKLMKVNAPPVYSYPPFSRKFFRYLDHYLCADLLIHF